MSEEIKELKPCPFCGHTPQVIYSPTRLGKCHTLEEIERPEAFSEYSANVTCLYCDASTHGIEKIGPHQDAVNAAITMWNNDFIYPVGESLPYRLFKALER